MAILSYLGGVSLFGKDTPPFIYHSLPSELQMF